ncbi:MAG TPA: response regulator [Thermoanaerobaculia bacterium]|nr:response regulator [Thermoanaerobaculia bacterium]
MLTEGIDLFQQAVSAAKRGDSGAARTLLLRASELDPANDLVWLWLARLAASTGDRIRYLRRVLASHPHHEVAAAELADALLAEGIAAAKEGAKAAARGHLEAALKLDETKEEAWLWLAAVASDRERQRDCLERILALNPGHRHALALLDLPELRGEPKPRPRRAGRCPLCRGTGLPEDRCPWCRAVISLADLKLVLRNRDVDRELVAAGLRRLESLPGGGENFDVRFALGVGCLNVGRVDEGIAHLEAASALRPEEAPLAAQVEVLRLWRKRPRNPAPARPRGTVLAVDDSPTVVKLVASSLEPRGFRVVPASDGLEALSRLRETRPDLVLLDVNLPGLDGYQICKLIKADPAFGSVPVVFLSGRGGLFDRMRGRLAGSAEYLSKPFKPPALLELIERLVPVRGDLRGEISESA